MDFDEGGTQELDQFVVLAQSLRGAACAALIRQVLAHPKVFVFGELLVVPSVQELANTEHAPALALLNTFAYGTWGDLTPDAAAALDEPMALKLKKLTVVSMCSSADVISYEVLQRAVAISAVRELEDLLISLIYEGLLRAKLDQRSKKIEVHHAIGRDVHPDDLPRMATKLEQW
jgi:COP9 signalosome complex subunit 7